MRSERDTPTSHETSEADTSRPSNLLEMALAASPDAIVVVDERGRLAYANEAGRRLVGEMGCPQAQLPPEPLPFTVVSVDGQAALLEARPLARALRGETVARAILGYRNHDGTIGGLVATAAPIVDSEGRLAGAICTCRDVSSEIAKNEASQHLAAIVRSSLDAIFTCTLEGVITSWNAGAERLLGYAAAEAVGRVQQEFVPPERAEELNSALERVGRGESVPPFETQRRHRDGRLIDVSVAMSPLRYPSGQIAEASTIIRDIGERKRAGEALRASEERFRQLAESAPIGIYESDHEGKCVYVNSQWCRITGQTSEEAMGYGWLQAIHPDDRPEVWQRWAEAVRRGLPTGGRYRCVRPGGEIAWVRAQSVVLRNSDGEPIGRVGAIRDVTEYMQARAEQHRLLRMLEAQRLQLQTALAYAPGMVAIARGPELVYELVNPHFQQLFPGQTLLGRTVFEVWADNQELVDAHVRVLRTGKPYQAADKKLHVRGTEDDAGRDVYVTLTLVSPPPPPGEPASVVAMAVDTTEVVLDRQRIQHLAEMAHRRAAELQAILDSMVDSVIVCNAEGELVMANPGARRLLGVDPVETTRGYRRIPAVSRVRRPDGQPVPPESLAIYRALCGQIITDEEQIIYNPTLKRDIRIRVNTSPIYGEKGELIGAVAVARDVTELLELDEMKEQLIATAAHELKTPLTVLKGYAQVLLRSQPELSLAQRKMLEGIDRGADRMNKVVLDLLQVSQLQLGRLEPKAEPIDLASLVAQAVEQVSMATRRFIRLKHADAAIVSGDRPSLEHVLINLLENAVKYSPQGGEIEVMVVVRGAAATKEAEARQEALPTLEALAPPPPPPVGTGVALVSVKDHGVGIPRDKQRHIFERFYRAHAGTPYDYGGLGIGLFVAHEIVERHGGHLWFESEEGLGSTFSFTLPLMPPA